MAQRAWLIICLALVGLGCTGASRVSHRYERDRGQLGWFRVYPRLSLDSGDALVLPPKTPDDGVDEDGQYMERVEQVYLRQFRPLFLSADTPCEGLFGDEAVPPGPVFILVHGVKGDGPEWWPVIAALKKAQPAGVFMLKWNVIDERGVILEDLVNGVNLIASCYPKARPLVLLAHSAGGVVASFAVSRLTVPPPQRLKVFTVASPLSGVGYNNRAVADDDDNSHLFTELGAPRQEYPAAAPRVTVTHLRTSPPADPVMSPNRFGYLPNRKGVGVKGAREIDLPTTLGHDESLFYVARQLVAGQLFDDSPATTAGAQGGAGPR